MKFGYILPNFGNKINPRELLDLAETCEEEGFDSVWATDHIIMPLKLREPYGQLLEPLTTLSYVAARTSRLRVGTSIIVLPQRNPVLVAKQAAALDVLSQGRLILGLGAGWAEEEFGFLNSDFHRRGRVFNESIRLMRELWSDDVVDFEGEFFRARNAVFLPKPPRGTIPIWIGGNGEPSIRRVILLGDGWHPVGPDLETFSSGVSRIRDAKRGATFSMRMTTDVRKKRDMPTTSTGQKRAVVSGSGQEIRKQIGEYEEAGLEYYCASMMHPSAEETKADIRRFASEVIRSY
jgi:probable F420-dependent oxidoreductase